MIAHLRQHCDSMILALLKPHEGALQSAYRSVVSDADDLVAAVREMLGEQLKEGCESLLPLCHKLAFDAFREIAKLRRCHAAWVPSIEAASP
jgi:hypothetical protein